MKYACPKTKGKICFLSLLLRYWHFLLKYWLCYPHGITMRHYFGGISFSQKLSYPDGTCFQYGLLLKYYWLCFKLFHWLPYLGLFLTIAVKWLPAFHLSLDSSIQPTVLIVVSSSDVYKRQLYDWVAYIPFPISDSSDLQPVIGNIPSFL